jgi:hypothetical protein
MSAGTDPVVAQTGECFVCSKCGTTTREIVQTPDGVCPVCRAALSPRSPEPPEEAAASQIVPILEEPGHRLPARRRGGPRKGRATR